MDLPPWDVILVLLVVYFVTTTINAWICSLIWQYRAKRRAYDKVFDTILGETKIGKSITTIAETIKTIQTKVDTVKDLDKEGVVSDLWKKIKGRLGGTQKAINAETRELEGAVSSVVQHEYPGCMWMSDNIDLALDFGLIDEGFKNGFLKAASNPRTFEVMEKVCLGIKNVAEGKKGKSTESAGGRPRF